MTTTSRGQALNVWMIVFTFLTVSTFVGRFVSYRLLKRNLRGDDFFVVLAFLSLLALQITTWMTIPKNLGAHYTDLTPEDAAWQRKIQYSAGVTWTLATVFCKVAVLWMYLHIFPPSGIRYGIYGAMVCSVGFAIAFIPIFMTACDPPSAVWDLDPMVALTHCRPIQRQEYASVAVNMALDLAVVVIPLPAVWQLRIAVEKKIRISLMFSLGLAVVGVSAWRIYTTVESTKTVDWSYILLTTALQSHLELWLGIIAANLPMMNPVLTKLGTPAIMMLKSWTSRTFSSSVEFSSKQELSHASSALPSRARKDFSLIPESNRSMEFPMLRVDKIGIRRDIEVNVVSENSSAHYGDADGRP